MMNYKVAAPAWYGRSLITAISEKVGKVGGLKIPISFPTAIYNKVGDA